MIVDYKKGDGIMIKMIDEKNITYDEALDKYPDCKILMINVVDDCRGTITGDLVAVSGDLGDFKSLCDMKKGYIKEQKDPLLIGDYSDGGAIGVQYEIKR